MFAQLPNCSGKIHMHQDSSPRLIKVSRERGDSITQLQRKEAEQRISLHNKWFSERFMGDDDTIMIVPRFWCCHRDDPGQEVGQIR